METEFKRVLSLRPDDLKIADARWRDVRKQTENTGEISGVVWLYIKD
jgi:hypothetical protein